MGAGRNHIGLDETHFRGTGAAERRHVIIGGIIRRVVVGIGADRDNERIVAGHANGHRVGAAIARRRDDHDAGGPQLLDGLVDGIGEIGRVDLADQREVDDANVVLVRCARTSSSPRECHRTCPCLRRRARVRRPGQRGARCRCSRSHPPAIGNQAGDEGAVAVAVPRARRVVQGVVCSYDSLNATSRSCAKCRSRPRRRSRAAR